MSREPRLILEDIAEACLKISEWGGNATFEDFVRHGMLYSAILRELLFIGEAIKQVDAEVRDRATELPWREWAGLRDVIVHQYFGLQDATLWQIVHDEVPALSAAVDALIGSLS